MAGATAVQEAATAKGLQVIPPSDREMYSKFKHATSRIAKFAEQMKCPSALVPMFNTLWPEVLKCLSFSGDDTWLTENCLKIVTCAALSICCLPFSPLPFFCIYREHFYHVPCQFFCVHPVLPQDGHLRRSLYLLSAVSLAIGSLFSIYRDLFSLSTLYRFWSTLSLLLASSSSAQASRSLRAQLSLSTETYLDTLGTVGR